MLLCHETPVEDDLLFKILDRVKNTLTFFSISGLTSGGNPNPHTHLRFPLMKRLETIFIASNDCKLGPGVVSDLHECLPNLKDLILYDQTEINFKNGLKDLALITSSSCQYV